MKYSLHTMQITAVLAFSVSFNAYADAWSCSHDNFVREVLVEYPEGGPVPCNVVYKKQTEGFEDQVLWSALNQEGYCEEKAAEFVVKLESWGWVCPEPVGSDETAGAASEQAAETAPEEVAGTASEQAAETAPEEVADTASEQGPDTAPGKRAELQ